MEFTRKQLFTLSLSLLLGFVAVLPHVTHALGNAADIFCGLQYCYPGKCTPSPKDPACIPCASVTCNDITSGFTTTGKCVSSAPGLCKAVGTSGKDGFGLGEVAKILGDLMGKLMQQGGGQPPPTTPPTGTGGDSYRTPPSCSISSSIVSSNASSTTATLSWSSLGEATSANITPGLGSVSPSGSQTVTVTSATPYSMTVTGPGGTNYCATTVFGGASESGADQCSALTEALYGCGDDGEGGDGNDAPTLALSASPTQGTAPLSVTFSINYSGQAGAPTLEYGDGTSEPRVDTCDAPADACISPGTNTHTYTTSGTYSAKLCHGTCISSANLIGSVTVTVSAATPNTNTNGTSTMATVFTTPASFLLPGLRGDIEVMNSRGTVFAGARDPGRNTEVAGFYGGSTFSGPATGVIASLCRSRPWASNILSYVLPANFFDSLCVARGYQVGNPPAPTQPSVTVTQTAPKPVASTTSATASTTAPLVPPRVRVWAVPATVSLGSRTSVFWSSQGVVSCLVTSPDGSFSQTSLSGGASTVALTGDTTFTISCLTHDGTPVTDFVTVRLAI